MTASSAPVTKRLYSLSEAATYLGRTIHAVRFLIIQGELSTVRTGLHGKRWIAIEELQAFVEKNTHTHAATPSMYHGR